MRPASRRGAKTWFQYLVQSVRPEGTMSSNGALVRPQVRALSLGANLVPFRHQITRLSTFLNVRCHAYGLHARGDGRFGDGVVAARLDHLVGAKAPELDGTRGWECAGDERVTRNRAAAWERCTKSAESRCARVGEPVGS